MLRGQLVLGLAMCVTGAPVATDLCQAACATRSADAPSHTCHAEAPQSGASLIAVHSCGHTDELPRVDRPEQVTAAFAIAPAVAIAAPEVHVVLPGTTPIQSNSPPLVALASQLRV